MNRNKLPTYRKILEEIRIGLVGDVEQNLKLSKEFDNQPAPDISDEAAKYYHSQLMKNLEDQEWETFKLLDEALEKIEKGSYGVCKKCEKPIPEARLDVVPFAQYCVVCQKIIEKSAERDQLGS